MTGHDFEPFRDSVVEDEFGGAVDEDLSGEHLVAPRLKSLTGMERGKSRKVSLKYEF